MSTEKDNKKLIELLDKAEHLAGQFSGGYSGQFLSAEEFHSKLVDSITKLKNGDNSQLYKLSIWFLPTSCWDDFVGLDGQELANEISDLLAKMTKDETRNNWRQKSLESLEKKTWPALSSDEGSYLIKTCNSLRKKQLKDFSTEDLRIMIGQEIGLYFLIPLAIETLTVNLFAEGDYYEGDLLKSVLDLDNKFWEDNKDCWRQLNELIKNRRQELKELRFDLTKFDYSKS